MFWLSPLHLARIAPKKSTPNFLLIFLLYSLLLLPGCGLMAKNSDPGASGADSANSEKSLKASDPVPYALNIEVKDGPAELGAKMRSLSQLQQLIHEPPDSMLALERRARADQETALRLLHSQCYYEGKANYSIDAHTLPVKVSLLLMAGPIFHLGKSLVRYEPEAVIPQSFLGRSRATGLFGLEREPLPDPQFPRSIPGLEIGKPVTAEAMLAAVDKIPAQLHRQGYPLARILESRYSLNPSARTLNAEIVINPGPPALMGEALFSGDKEVSKEYLRRLLPWKPDKQPWDEQLLQEYANTLRGLGLFRSVEAKAAIAMLKEQWQREGDLASLPAEISLSEGPARSLSASARYDTSSGFGVEGLWEHRNLFHNGERLTLAAPISTEESGLKMDFEKPAFLRPDQRLLANAAALWENTSAYRQSSMRGELGIDRKLAKQWWGGIHLYAEGGLLKDNEHPEHAYAVLSPRANLRFDSRNNRLNPTSGMLGQLKLKPFSGYYWESFQALASEISLAAFYTPLRRQPDGKLNERIVLAGRVQAGAMPASSSLRSIPASLRYYSGGAGSVRGYAYQAIGPRDKKGEPLGGRSFQVLNLESRFMVSKDIGIVPFLDGGMVFREEMPKILSKMDWGTGIGLRYYTPIGPVRLDVATPLRHIDNDPPIQVYISIGQSF